MFARISGAATLGLGGHVIAVETDISNGLPSFDLVGLASTSVKEAKERVRAAIKNSGYEFPMRRLTVNLAPADLKKDTSGLDLGLAIAILASSGQIPLEACADCLFLGELALDGEIRPVNGVLPMVIEECRPRREIGICQLEKWCRSPPLSVRYGIHGRVLVSRCRPFERRCAFKAYNCTRRGVRYSRLRS